MIQPLPSFPPLLPSGDWWIKRLEALVNGVSREESIIVANNVSHLKSREWMRFRVADRSFGETMLSMPVVHGASALKNRSPESWRIADSPSGLRKLDSTLATLYGHTPFYHLIAPELSLKDTALKRAEEVCRKLDEAVLRVLGLDNQNMVKSLEEADFNSARFASLSEKMESFNPSLSIADSIFRYGPQTIIKLKLR